MPHPLVLRLALASVLLAVVCVAARTPSWAADKPTSPQTAGGTVDFNRDVRPILAKNCWACHGPDEEARKGNLRLDQREPALLPAASGQAAIVPGKPDESELVLRIESRDDADRMPPPGTGHDLTPSQIDVLKRWVAQKAPFAEHWSFVPPSRPAVPAPATSIPNSARWVRNPIDAFVLARMTAAGLTPEREADRHEIIRRLSLDLRGLPPSPVEVREFVADSKDGAYERLVDRFLADSAYGERWARMWLDIARYADSAGYGSDPLRLNIWPYRDWVVGAFNRNLPYDQFSLEQLAGDLLPDATQEQRMATAFHRNTMTNTEGGTDDEEFRVIAVRDRVDTTIQAWMGLTMGCAKCHNHKYDPVSQEDYYRFFAIFNQTADRDAGDESPLMPIVTPSQKSQLEAIEQQLAALRSELAAPNPAVNAARAEWEASLAAGAAVWEPLPVSSISAKGGATFTKLDDGSWKAEGPAPMQDTYSVVATLPLAGVTAFRLETIPDDSFPAKGAGRGPDGNFVLSRFAAISEPVDTDSKSPAACFVRVELPGDGKFLHLAEIQAFSKGENVARQGKATQSSTDYDGPAELAIDGNTNGHYFEGKSVTHTRQEANPWWEVDLLAPKPIERVVFWSRTDGGTYARLDGVRVSLLDEARKTVWTQDLAKAPATSHDLSPTGVLSIDIAGAVADHSQAQFPIASAVKQPDLAKSGWAVSPQIQAPHWGVFLVGKPSADAAPRKLTITLDHAFAAGHYTLGRFRLSVTRSPGIERRLAVPAEILAIVDKPADKRSPEESAKLAAHHRTIATALAPLRDKIANLEKTKPTPVALPVMQELPEAQRRKSFVMVKGNFLAPGKPVDGGFPGRFASAAVSTANPSRLDAARWLFDPSNPLTARVAVNRFWAQLFGTGLVETEEDFGTQGELPSHPELLDWLAVEFREPSTKICGEPSVDGAPQDRPWDVKRFLKLIVTSSTYRQAAVFSPAKLQKDSRNRWLSRGPRTRLEAEMVRDQALALSGLLSRKTGGPSVYPHQPDGLWQAAFNGQRTWPTSTGEDRYRRGLYVFWRRTVPYPSMATFDAPSRETCSIRRPRTNTPLQAFVTMNDPVYVECSQALARRLMAEGGATPESRVRFGLELCLGRPASEKQIAPLTQLFTTELGEYSKNDADAKAAAGETLPMPAGVTPAEVAAWTVVANVLLNLDGLLMK
jgi:hypothetical protein